MVLVALGEQLVPLESKEDVAREDVPIVSPASLT